MDTENFKVDFIGLGAPRAASSWIYYCLKEHPQICMSKRKETGYFAERNYRKGIKFYNSFFSHCRQGQKRGDSTPPYLFQDGVAEKIKEYNPNVKLYVCLRDPIDRAYSSYLCHLSGGHRNVLFSFEEAIKEFEEAYVKPSKYYSCLTKYLEFFPKENILILFYEDIAKDPLAFIQKLYKFLGVDENFVPQTVSKRVNVVKEGTIKHKTFLKFIWKVEDFLRRRRDNFFIKPVYIFFRFRCFKLWKKIKDMGIKKTDNLPRQERKPLKFETKVYLHKIFDPETEKIEKLTGRNLNQWKKISK